MRDCSYSRNIWQHIGFNDTGFFAVEGVADWIKEGMKGPHATTFAAGLWWVWMSQNYMCINNEQMPIHRVAANIKNSSQSIAHAFPSHQTVHMDRHIRWNNNNFDGNILNVDGSCIGNPTRAGFRGLIRNSAGCYITGFSGFLPASTDILQAELSAIYFRLCSVKDLGIAPLACYSNSLLAINTIKEASSKFHVYAVIIHEIKLLLSQMNVSLNHTLREGNQCADFLAKLGAFSNDGLVVHSQPPDNLRPLLRTDALGTLFLRA
jgi:ribonuclease HI